MTKECALIPIDSPQLMYDQILMKYNELEMIRAVYQKMIEMIVNWKQLFKNEMESKICRGHINIRPLSFLESQHLHELLSAVIPTFLPFIS